MNNSKDDKINTNNTPQEKTNNVENAPETQKLSKLAIFALVGVSILMFLAIGMTIALFVVSLVRGGKSEQGNMSDYLAIFAILITLISIVVPITSYITNKDEVKKLSLEFRRTRNALQKDVDEKVKKQSSEFENSKKELGEEYQKLLSGLDVRYTELLENIVNKSTITNNAVTSDYVKAHILYVNALNLFKNGIYDKCERNLDDVIDAILDLQGENDNSNDIALLLYKSVNLYRKALGRTRFIGGNLFERIDKILVKYNNDKKSNIYKVAAYMYVTVRFDKFEKSFTKTDDVQLIEGTDQLINTLKSDEPYGDLYYNTLLARKYQITAYFSNNMNLYKGAIDCAQKARVAWWAKRENERDEAEKRLDAKSAFTIVKVMEKSSIACKGNEYETLLDNALKIVQELIRNDKNCKYFLEVSEIYKKLNDREKSDYAAEYGLSLSPSDTLLAAQCAYIYLRKYFANTNNLAYLIKAEEHISTAYWVYLEEKSRYNDKSNSKLHYIASLHAVISAFTLISTGKKTIGKEESKIIENIYNSIDNSIADNPNNVPNYKRALLVYVGLAEQFVSNKAEYLDKIKLLVDKFKENITFNFNEEKDANDKDKSQSASDNKLKEDIKELVIKMNKINTKTVTYKQVVEVFDDILKNPKDNI